MKRKINCLLAGLLCSYLAFSQSLFPVWKEHNSMDVGYINSKGVLMAPYSYSDARDFSEGFALVYKGGKFGFINHLGKEVSGFIYSDAQSFHNGFAWVKEGEKSYFVDKEFKKYPISNLAERGSKNFFEGLVMIQVNYKKGFANIKNQVIIPAEFDEANDFFEGVAVVKKEKKTFLVSTDGKLTDLPYKEASVFSEGLLAVKNEQNKCGYVDHNLKEVIPCKFEQVGDFHSGYAVFIEGDKEGLINKKGEIVLPATYKRIYHFNEGMVFAKIDYSTAILFDANLKQVKKFTDLEDGVESGLYFINGLCRLHLIHRDKTSKNENIRNYGGVITIYIDKTGKTVWQSKAWYSCFPADSKVKMADFSEKNIQEIQAGDRILSFNAQSGNYESTTVLILQEHRGSFEVLELTVAGFSPSYATLDACEILPPTMLRATPNHPVLTTSGVKRMGDLQANELVFLWNEEDQKFEPRLILSLEKSSETTTVFNIQTVSDTYVVNGMVVLRK